MQPNSNYSNYPSNPSQFNSQPSSSLQPGTGQGFSISPNGFALGQYIKSQAQSQPDPNLSQANPPSYPSQTQQNSNANYQQPASLPQQNIQVPQSNQQQNYSMEQSFSPQKHLQNLQNSQVYQQHASNNPQQNAGNYQNNNPLQQNNANNYSNNPQMNAQNPVQNPNNFQQNANNYSNNPPQNLNNSSQNPNNYPNNASQNLNNSFNKSQVNAQNPNNYSQNLPSNAQNLQQGSNYYPPQNNSQNTSFTSPEPLPQQQAKPLEQVKPKPTEQQQEQKGGVALEEIPDFLPFIEPNTLKSQIPYPKDPAKIEGSPALPGKYSFTPNINAFYVLEEERNTAVLKSEAMKPHMIYKESLINEWVDEELPHDITCVTRDPNRQELFRAVSWKKLSEVAPEDGFAIIYDTNSPQNLITGLLNDRALQSALAVLAENEDFFPYIFPEFNPFPAVVEIILLVDQRTKFNKNFDLCYEKKIEKVLWLKFEVRVWSFDFQNPDPLLKISEG